MTQFTTRAGTWMDRSGRDCTRSTESLDTALCNVLEMLFSFLQELHTR